MLADSAFPTGAFAHSWGLEWAIRTGWVTGAADLYPWIRDALRFGVAPLEGRAVARSAWLVAGGGAGERAEAPAVRLAAGGAGGRQQGAAGAAARVIRLSDQVASFLPAREARHAGGQLGRSLLAAAAAAFPVLLRSAYYGEVARGSGHRQDRLQFPAAWGLVGGLLGIGTGALVQAYLLNTVRQWSQVAMRTIPIGQSAALGLIGRLLDETSRLAEEMVRVRRPLASIAPGWEFAVAGHGELDARYFRS